MIRSMAAFGLAEIRILWDGGLANMPGWEQQSYTNSVHIPGSNITETFLLGVGDLTRTFTVECETPQHYRNLQALVQAEATLRVPAAMNELAAREVDYFGQLYAEIDDVVLLGLSAVSVWADGSVSCAATFQVSPL